MLESFRNFADFSQLSKWPRRLVSVVAGMGASLALPPADIWPTVFVAFSVLVLQLDGIDEQPIAKSKKFKAAFACGWLFGFGYFVISLYWIGAAFLVEADKFAALMPLAVAALPAGIAIFWGLACALAMMMWRPGVIRIFVLATVFTFFEWTRGLVFTGFPWNTIGYTSAGMGGFDQMASFVGLYGVTFMVLVFSMSPVLLVGKQRQLFSAGVLLAGFVGTWIAGNAYLNRHLNAMPGTGPVIRIVQPNIDQKKKWDRAFAGENIEKYFKLSALGPEGDQRPVSARVQTKSFDALIWPESALPLLFDENRLLKARVAELLPPNSFLVLGALRRESTTTATGVENAFFNSVQVVDSDGKIAATYDKFHLVPFGEYLPGEEWLTPLGLRKIVAIPGGFNKGTGPQTLQIGTLPAFSPLICYEIGFPGQVVDPERRPDWIVNVTNDGWFGKTAGPYQHLAQARFRAIEQGIPVIRAANTGISAAIDSYGRIISTIGLGKSGVMDVVLPPPRPPTVFARYGDRAALLLIVGMLIIFIGLPGVLRSFRRAGKVL